MVAIRLSRQGKKNHATYRFVVSDKRKDTLGASLEILGSYDPHATPAKIELKEDRVKYWLSQGAKPSDTVHNLLVEKGVISEPKRVIVVPPKAVAPDPEAVKAETPATDATPATEETKA